LASLCPRITAAHFFVWAVHELGYNVEEDFPEIYESLQVLHITVTSKNDPTDMLMANMGTQYRPETWYVHVFGRCVMLRGSTLHDFS
jgi:hypothetical protein